MSMDLWLPFGAASFVETRGAIGPSTRVVTDRSVETLLISGILKEGYTAASAESQLTALAAALERAYPEHNRDQRLVVSPRSRVNMGPRPRSDSGPAAGAVVLMAVASLNLANILLARGSVRQQEIAVRLALGGSRSRVVQQLLIEGFLLSAMGGVAALLMAWWASIGLLSSLTTTAIPIRVSLDTSPDGRVVMAVLVACLASTVAFALLPAWTLSKTDLAVALKQSMADRLPHRRRLSAPMLLVSAQIALSLALLVAAGVFVRAGINASSADPGFPLPGGLLAEIDVGIASLDETRGRVAFAGVLDRVRAVPGVRAASGASMVPFGSTRIDQQVTRGSATTTATFTVGVYGLRAYMVAQRTREMGIRIALGATRRDVIGELLREGVRMTAAALLVGGALGLGLIQVLRGSGMLFEVSSTDPFVFTIAPLVLAAAIAAASYIAARRAVGIDPALALRSE